MPLKIGNKQYEWTSHVPFHRKKGAGETRTGRRSWNPLPVKLKRTDAPAQSASLPPRGAGPAAATGALAALAKDVSEQFVAIDHPNGDRGYHHAPVKSTTGGKAPFQHGISARVTPEGDLVFTIRAAHGTKGAHGSDTDLFLSLMRRFERDGIVVNRILNDWRNVPQMNDGYEQFHANVGTGMSDADAARATALGRIVVTERDARRRRRRARWFTKAAPDPAPR